MGKIRGGAGGAGDVEVHRKTGGMAAAVADFGEEIRAAWGLSGFGSWGNWKRRDIGLNRNKQQEFRGTKLPAIKRRNF